MYTRTPTKRLVRVTLDIACYDDLDLESLDWGELLDLDGDECVEHVNVQGDLTHTSDAVNFSLGPPSTNTLVWSNFSC